MFTQQLPAEVFTLQREFIKAMGGKLDFEWVALTLISEETRELKEAYERKTMSDENLGEIFKEMADVIYVVAYFYNTMPVYAPELLSEERNQAIQDILDTAADTVSLVSHKLHLPFPLVLAAYKKVHASNMSKLGNDGKPVYRKDGKIMKGPNYHKPDMTSVVKAYKQFLMNKSNGETSNA